MYVKQRKTITADAYKSGVQASNAFSSLSNADAVGSGITDTSTYYGKRPTWRQSEIDGAGYYPVSQGYEYNQSYKMVNGKLQEVSWGTSGSVRPDYYSKSLNKCVDIKNYTITTASGRTSLANNVSAQYNQRVNVFPSQTTYEVRIDVRGQVYDQAMLDDIRNKIQIGTGGNMSVKFINQ